MLKVAWRLVCGAGWRSAVAALLAVSALAASCLLWWAARDFDRSVRGASGAWLGADMAALANEPLDAGPEASLVLECHATIRTKAHPDGRLVLLKAVDPARYPLRGRLELEGAPLAEGGAAVSADLGAAVGEAIEVGTARLRVTSRIVREPDRLSGMTSATPRVLLDRNDFERSRIARSLPVTLYRYLYLGHPPLEEMFPQAQVLAAGDGNPDLAEAARRTGRALHGLGWLALGLAGAAVAVSSRLLLDVRQGELAVWKTLGARPWHVVALALACALWTALAGGPALAPALACVAAGAAGLAWARPAELWRGRARPVRWLRRWRSRPGQRHAPAQFVFFALAAAASGGAWRMERDLAPALQAAWPGAQAALFVVNASDGQWNAARTALRGSADLVAEPIVTRLHWVRMSRNRVMVSCREGAPAGVVVSAKAASSNNLRVGDEIALGQGPRTRIVRIEDRSPIEEYWRAYEVPCAAVRDERGFHFAALPVRAGAEQRVRHLLLEAVPGLPVEDRREMVSHAQNLVSQASRYTRALALYLVLAAAMFTLLLTAAAWQAQQAELGVWKALGATPAKLLGAQTRASAMTGLIAGAAGLHWAILLGSAALSALCGAIASWEMLRRRPMELMRRR